MEKIDLLLAVTKATGFYKEAQVTTAQLALEVKCSQQSISNSLRRLERDGLIRRRSSQRGIQVSLSTKGRTELIRYKKSLSMIIPGYSTISGTVFTGLGEGRFYTQEPQYKRILRELLGGEPYPGTLNLSVSRIKKDLILQELSPIKVKGFKDKNRTFGSLKCYKVTLNKIPCAVVIPRRSIHKGVLEIVSQVYLRKALRLADGDKARVKF